MAILRIILAIIGGAITLIREIRHLVHAITSDSAIVKYLKDARHQEQIAYERVINMQEVQIEMEKLFHKNQLHARIKKEFTDADLPFKEIMIKNKIDPTFGFSLLVQMVLHKRAGVPVLVGILRKHFKGDCQATADALLLACQIDLVDWNPRTKQFIVKYDITPDVQQELDTYQFPMPMVVPPKELQDNTDTGYYTSRNSVILKDNHHDFDVCLDHLNHVNSVKLTLNHRVTSMIKNQWRNLDKPKTGEEHSEYKKRVKAFEKYDRTAYEVMGHLDIAGTEFYLTHKYDKRGRVYCQGYHINYQGNTWNKAVIEFADQETVDG
jgi:hypothetical protein